jgi:hypothetical protein
MSVAMSVIPNGEPQTIVTPRLPGMVALLGVLMSVFAAVALAGEMRERIIIVGSSTVYPFSAAVAEHFARSGPFPAPTLSASSTGEGFRLLLCRDFRRYTRYQQCLAPDLRDRKGTLHAERREGDRRDPDRLR